MCVCVCVYVCVCVCVCVRAHVCVYVCVLCRISTRGSVALCWSLHEVSTSSIWPLSRYSHYLVYPGIFPNNLQTIFRQYATGNSNDWLTSGKVSYSIFGLDPSTASLNFGRRRFCTISSPVLVHKSSPMNCRTTWEPWCANLRILT